MSNLGQAVWVELLKARRANMPLLTLFAFSLAPFAGGFFMFVLKDPELARRMGVISAKAQITVGSADWPTYLGLLAQAIAIGGYILFSFIASWVFGREYADHTVNDLLALPTPRAAVVLAKFAVITLWSALLTIAIYLLGLGVGVIVALPPTSAATIVQGTLIALAGAGLTMALSTPIAFFASAGHGYMAPMGFAILTVILAQVIAAAGWGEYFPWAVPALYTGTAGPLYADLGPASFALVLLTGLAGLLATFVWWERADQTH